MSIKKHKRIYIYIDSQLPECGWFQECFYCNTITAKHILFDTYECDNNYCDIYIYLCPKCKLKKTNKTFIFEYHKFMYNKYPEIYEIIYLNILNDNANILQKWWTKTRA
jgi:hypothetical protein